MSKLFILLFLQPAVALSQNSFDGTWLFTAPLPQKPALYMLARGMYRCSGCLANMEIKADGEDHKVTETDYWDTVNVQVVDAHSLVFIAKKSGKTMFTEVDAVSSDGGRLVQLVKDTTEAETVTIETRYRRIEKGPAGSHTICGAWRAYKINRSRNGSISQYKCTAEGFTAETPLGERFSAKFDGMDYPVADDPGHTMVSARRLSPNIVELTSKRNGQIVGIKQMSVAPDGKSMHVIFKNADGKTASIFDLKKIP